MIFIFVKISENGHFLWGNIPKIQETKTVPYLPITPQMRAGVKSVPYSLFTIPLAAGTLGLSQLKAKAATLNPNMIKVRDPNGMTHYFTTQQAADNFKKAANLP